MFYVNLTCRYVTVLNAESGYRGVFTADPSMKSSDGILPDTFMDMPGWAKGVAFINGFNLGWYWPKAGPQMTMYIPGPMLQDGDNELILLEVEESPEKPTGEFIFPILPGCTDACEGVFMGERVGLRWMGGRGGGGGSWGRAEVLGREGVG